MSNKQPVRIEEEAYIAGRRKQADELSERFRSMQKYPIEKRKIVFSAFEGDGGFCCNPRYIAAELIKRMNAGKAYDLVWLTRDTSKHFPEPIRAVEYTPDNIAYELSTAKVWVDNYRKPYGTLKRPGQLYIQTWHATIGFKAVGLYRGDKFPEIARIVSEYDSGLADWFLSNSDYCRKVYPQKLLYSGPLLQVGSPRVDILVNDRKEIRRIIRERYGISPDDKIVMFAPTFRGGNQKGEKKVISEIPSLDFEMLKDTLSQRFGSDWTIFLRLHPQLSAKLETMPVKSGEKYMVDVSRADDMSELLAACDLLITDYSSCAFDALYSFMPVLLYADDVQDYIENRGEFMWKREELPFSIAENNEELERNIRAFDEEKYKKAAESFMNRHGIREDGQASRRVADVIDRFLEENNG